MTTQFFFNQVSGQTITGTPSSLDELSVALTPWPADRQLFMYTVNASTLQLGTVRTPSTVGGYPEPSSFIPLYEIRRDPFQPNTFHLVELGAAGIAASATLNDIDLVSFAVPGGSELFTINLQPLILSGEAVGGTEGITEIQGTPFNDRPVITLTGISKPTAEPTEGGNGLVFKNGSATTFEVVTSMGSPSQGAQTTSGTVLRVYDTTTGQPVHEYQLDSAVESVQLVFDDGAATIKGLFSSVPNYSDAVPMSLVKSIVTSPDPIRIASMGNPSDPDTIHFRVDLNESIYLQEYGQSADPYQSYSLKFALKIGNNVVYADIEGANGDYSRANQLWFAYPIKATDVGAVSMLGLVEVNGTDASAFAPYTNQTEYTGIGSLGNQALSYIYPKIEFANDPTLEPDQRAAILTTGGNKFVGLFDPTEINLVAEANVVLTGNRNTLGIAIDGTGGALLSATQAGGVISIFTQVGTTSTRVAKFTQSSTDPTQYLFWTGANVDSTDVGVATAISTADFQQVLLILRVQGSETDHVAQVGGAYWTFADQKPLLFSLVSREFVEPERPNDLAKVGDAFNNILDVSAEAASKSIDLFGFQGNDTITGHDGANRIAGGAGSDTINAGKGNDALILGGMSDGPGDDVVDLGDDTDVISFNGFDNAHLFQAGTVKTAAGTEVFEIRETGAAGARLVATVEKADNFATASQVLVTTYQADGVTPFNTALVSNAESLVNFGNNSQPYFLKGSWSPSTNGTSYYQGSIFSDVIDLSNASLKSADFIYVNGGLGDDTLLLQTTAPLSTGGQWSMVSENGLTTWSYSQQGSVSPEFSISKRNQSGYEDWSIDDLTGAGSKTLSGLQISEVERIEIKNGTNVLRTISLVDFSAPVYQSASLRGNQLTVVFNEALDPVEKPAIEHFTLDVDGQPQSNDGVQITNAQVVGNKLTLTLSQPFNDLTRQVAIAYADPNLAMDDSFVLQDIYGNDVSTFKTAVQVIGTNLIQPAKEKFTTKSEFFGGSGKDILDMSAAEESQEVNLFYTKSDQPHGRNHTIRDIEDLKGSNLSDTLKGNGWANTLDGNAGNDVLDGGLGDDVLLGGAGNDQLLGGFGRDVLYGGTGSDEMTGGIGGDQFVLSVDDATAGGLDNITDFNFIADVIQIHANAGATLDALASLFDTSKTLIQLGAAAPTGTEASVYYDSTDKLYFDAGGAANPVLLAQFDQVGGSSPELLAANIKLIDVLPTLIV